MRLINLQVSNADSLIKKTIKGVETNFFPDKIEKTKFYDQIPGHTDVIVPLPNPLEQYGEYYLKNESLDDIAFEIYEFLEETKKNNSLLGDIKSTTDFKNLYNQVARTLPKPNIHLEGCIPGFDMVSDNNIWGKYHKEIGRNMDLYNESKAKAIFHENILEKVECADKPLVYAPEEVIEKI